MTILVFIEQRDGKVRSVAREALGEAKRLAAALGGPVVGVFCGASADGLQGLGEAGAEKVLAATHEAFARYDGAGYAAAVAAAAKATSAKLVLFGASSIGKDLAPRVAAKLGVGLAADCTTLDASGGKLVARRPVMAGKAFERVAFPAGSHRSGLLGQASFLTSNAGPVETSPTARGIFVREQFLCQHVPKPPPGVNTEVPEPTIDKPLARRLFLRMAALQRTGGTSTFLVELEGDPEVDDEMKGPLAEIAQDTDFLFALEEYVLRTRRVH